MQLQFVSMASTVALSKDAFPTRQRASPANPSSSLPKQAHFSCVSRQAQFRLSFALRSLAARRSQGFYYQGFRARLDLRFGTFTRRGSRLEN
jgi:hypothetical protein